MPEGLLQSNQGTEERVEAESHQEQVSSTSHLLGVPGAKHQAEGR